MFFGQSDAIISPPGSLDHTGVNIVLLEVSFRGKDYIGWLLSCVLDFTLMDRTEHRK